MTRVLVTGSAGAIGGPVCAALREHGHEVRGFDRLPSPEAGEARLGEITDRGALEAAMTGMDAVIHLAAHPDDAPFEQLAGPNVLGLYNVMNAARVQRVQRVVLASSVQVLWGVAGEGRRTAADTAPRNHYALTKVWAEQMGEMYAHAYGMSVIAARIAWMTRNVREARHMISRGETRSYLSRGDAGRFMLCAITAKEVDFAVLYAVGAGGHDRYDLETAKRRIGYEPRDVWPAGFPFELPDELRK